MSGAADPSGSVTDAEYRRYAGVVVATPAVRQAFAILDDLLRDQDHGGLVTAITGPPGSGRSTLSVRLCEHARAAADSAEVGVTVMRAAAVRVPADMPPGRFFACFVDAVTVADVVDCVAGYYPQIIGPMIASPGLRERVLRMVATDRQAATTGGLLAGFGLSTTTVLDRLRSVLADVVRDPEMALAFTLLLRDGLQASAWSWLCGEPPDALMRERGLTRPHPGGLGQIAVFARLYQRQARRVVLVVDDADTGVLADVPRRGRESTTRELAELGEAGAGVFLLGAEGAFAAPDLARIVDVRIHLTPFARADVDALLEPRAGEPPVEVPSEVRDDIVSLTRGNPHVVVRLITRLARRADGGEAVTSDVARAEAEGLFAVDDHGRLVDIIRGVLEQDLVHYSREYPATTAPTGLVNFWIPVNGGAGGGAILIVDSVAEDGDVEVLEQTAADLGRNYTPFQGLVVVGRGWVRPRDRPTVRHVQRLEAAFGRAPLSYNGDRFAADVRAEIKSMLAAIEDDPGTATVSAIVRQLRQLQEGQEREMSVLAGIQDLVRAAETRAVAVADPADPDADLPGDMAELFRDVVERLNDVAAPVRVAGALFSVGPDAADLTMVATDSAMQALGWAAFMRELATAFRAGMAELFRRRRIAGSDADDDADRRALEATCVRYDLAIRAVRTAGGRPLAGLADLPFTVRPDADTILATETAVRELADRVRSAWPRPA